MGVEKPPEWLPSGWTMDVRVRTKGATAGSKDKYYIERLTGKKFRSKVQINRYLKSKELENPLNPNRGWMENIQSRGCELSGLPKWLPANWIMEIKPRKKSSFAKLKVDKTYIEPITGYKFRSKNEVFHHLESEKLESHMSSSKKRWINNIYSTYEECSPPSGSKSQKLPGSSRRSLFQRPSSSSTGKLELTTSESPLMISYNGGSESMIRECSLRISENLLHASGEGGQFKGEDSDGGADEFESGEGGKPSSSAKLAGEKEKGLQAKVMISSARPKATRSKKRKTRPKQQLENTAKKVRVGSPRLASRKPKAEKKAGWARGTSNRLSRLQADPTEAKPPGTEPLAELPQFDSNCPRKEPPEKLSEKPDSPVISLFENLWDDPCLEFAIKTLTGEIPVEDYLREPVGPAPSQNSKGMAVAVPGSDGLA